MSHSLAQKANQNYLKEYAKLKRQSLNSLIQSKANTLNTEEDEKHFYNNYFEIQKDGNNIKLKRPQNQYKNTHNDQPNQSLKSTYFNQTSQMFPKQKQNLNSEQFSNNNTQRKSLESLLSQRQMNQKVQESNDPTLKSISNRSILYNPNKKQIKDQVNIIISDLGGSDNSASQAYGLQNNFSGQNFQDTQKQSASTFVEGADVKSKPKTKQLTRSSFSGQVSYYQQVAEQKKESMRQKNKEKKIQYKNFIESLESRKQTFTKFSFKSYERDDNPFLNPLIQKVNNLELKGSMHVIDLWEDKALKKYLNYSNLKDGKYMLRGIAQQINQDQLQQKKDAPTIFTKKDEYILQGKLHDKESMNNYIKHINEEYVKNQKLLDIKIQKSGLSQAISRQSIILPSETSFQQIIPNKRNSSTKIDQDLQFNDIEFIKNFFQRTQSLASLSPQKYQSQLFSPSNPFQSDKINTCSSASPQKKDFQNYFFPSQTNQHPQLLENSAENFKQQDQTQLSAQKSQFLQVPTLYNFDSPKTQISKRFIFSSDLQQNHSQQAQNSRQNFVFTPNNQHINSSELNSTNCFSQKKRSDFLKVTQFSSIVEKEDKKVDSAKLNNFLSKNIKNNQKVKINNQLLANKILKTEELNSTQRSNLYTSKVNGENKIQDQIDQHKILEKINTMFKEIDNIQKSDLSQKKKIDDLIEKMQDRVIISIQNQKKKILDNDRINNLQNEAQK